MNKSNLGFVFLLAFLGIVIGMSQATAQTADSETLERGKYLVITGGCNDCHTQYVLPGEEPETPYALFPSLLLNRPACDAVFV